MKTVYEGSDIFHMIMVSERGHFYKFRRSANGNWVIVKLPTAVQGRPLTEDTIRALESPKADSTSEEGRE